MVLGAIVIIITGILVVNYFRDRKGSVSETGSKTEISENGFAKMHVVGKGENLWGIAQNEIGSGYNWVDIAKANNLTNPNIITEGQKLVIPSVEPIALKTQTDQTLESQSNNTVTDAITGATYEVVTGDNLWKIAVRAYGDGYKWTEIAKENHLINPGVIHPGNILALSR